MNKPILAACPTAPPQVTLSGTRANDPRSVHTANSTHPANAVARIYAAWSARLAMKL